MPSRKKQKIQTPLVTAEEEAKAKEYLEETSNNRKAHSSMTWYLKSVQAKPEYDGWSTGAKRAYFVAFTAEHLKTKGTKVQRSMRAVETTKQKEKQYVWMSFEQLKMAKGEKKAKLLTQCGKLPHRPCPITGDDSQFGREWRIPTDMESEVESDRSGMQLQSETELNWSEETIKEAIETIDSCSQHIAESSNSASDVVPVKQEVSTSADAACSKQESKTSKALMADPRKFIRIVGDQVSDLKLWFSMTKEMKYCGDLHEDVKLELSKFVGLFKELEDFEIAMKTAQKCDEADVLALTESIDLAKDSFDHVKAWVATMCGTKGKDKAAKPRKGCGKGK